MKKLMLVTFLVMLIAVLTPSAVLADDFVGGVVTIDTPWTTNGTGTNSTLTLIEAIFDTGATDITTIEVHVTAADTLNTIDIDFLDILFPNMTVLTTGSETLFDYNADSVPGDIGIGFFSGHTLIHTVSLETVKEVGNSAFYGCPMLTSVTFNNAVTVGGVTFFDCDELASVTMPKAETFGDSAFYGCSSLASITLEEALTFGNQAFSGCLDLVTVNMPKATAFGFDAFRNCFDLVTITLPKAKTFGDNAFWACTFASVTLPNAETFGDYAFRECSNLTSVNLPSAAAFGAETFDMCIQPMSLTLGSTVPTVVSFGESFFSVPIPLAGSSLSVPYGTLAAFDNDPNDLAGSGVADDSLWYDWPITEQAQVINPRTGDSASNGIYLYSSIAAVLAGLASLKFRKRKQAK